MSMVDLEAPAECKLNDDQLKNLEHCIPAFHTEEQKKLHYWLLQGSPGSVNRILRYHNESGDLLERG